MEILRSVDGNETADHSRNVMKQRGEKCGQRARKRHVCGPYVSIAVSLLGIDEDQLANSRSQCALPLLLLSFLRSFRPSPLILPTTASHGTHPNDSRSPAAIISTSTTPYDETSNIQARAFEWNFLFAPRLTAKPCVLNGSLKLPAAWHCHILGFIGEA